MHLIFLYADKHKHTHTHKQTNTHMRADTSNAVTCMQVYCSVCCLLPGRQLSQPMVDLSWNCTHIRMWNGTCASQNPQLFGVR